MTEQHLVPFLKDVVSKVTPFGNLISYIHIRQVDDGRVEARISADDGSLHISCQSIGKIDLQNARLCLGNIGYLQSMLNSSMMKADTPVELTLRERNGKPVIAQLMAKPNKRMALTYVATDPFRSSIIRPGNLTIDNWPVTFAIDGATQKEIAEFKKIHDAAPSTGQDSVVEIGYADGEIILEFGDINAHNATLKLPIEPETTSNSPVRVKILSEHLIRALSLSLGADNSIPIQLCGKAIRLFSENTVAEYQLTVVGRKTRDD